MQQRSTTSRFCQVQPRVQNWQLQHQSAVSPGQACFQILNRAANHGNNAVCHGRHLERVEVNFPQAGQDFDWPLAGVPHNFCGFLGALQWAVDEHVKPLLLQLQAGRTPISAS